MAAGAAGTAGNSSRALTPMSRAVFRHVVCLTGLSPEGAVAEAHAGLLARASGANLTLFHVSNIGLGYSPDGIAPVNGIGTAAERLARATLEGEAQATGVQRARRQVVVERESPTAETMAAAVRRLGADVVVMAPHDRGILSLALGFSLTEATVDCLKGAVPVLCARGEARPYRSILVATDFSTESRRSFRLAARLAGLFGAAVTVLHAVAHTAEADGALASLRRFVPRALAHHAPRLMVEVGEPCAVILSTARAIHADLVVLSTRGRDSLRDAMLGTHAQRVIRHAPCPVLVS
jgi:nucleotide-binding universal stress UspA family protein